MTLNVCLLAFTATFALTSGQTYQPGNLNVFDQDMYLSQGLTTKLIAVTGQQVQYSNGAVSTAVMHAEPDGAAVFADERPGNVGGWVYVSNSEVEGGGGGVGGFTFDANGNVIDYRRLLTGTERNCNGGKTQWNTWISCEEADAQNGKAWQVDPFGVRDSVPITLGSSGGAWEAFAHDTRDPDKLYAFLTEDAANGAIQRMTINNPNYTDPWNILLNSGEVHYLLLNPIGTCGSVGGGTFQWTTDEAAARENARDNYPYNEGMEIDGNLLRFVAKELFGFFVLNLDLGTYMFEETNFEGQPDQFMTVFQEDGTKMIYFTEESPIVSGVLGHQVGVYTRNQAGAYTQILFGDDYSSETTGIAFSPDGKHMYFAYQEDGYLFDVTRIDGLSFFGPALAPPCTPAESIRKAWSGFTTWMFRGGER